MTKKLSQTHQFRILILLFLIVAGLFIAGCNTSHILHYKSDVSRDYTYIDFARNPDPFQVTSNVGGEHIRYIKILGFEGDKFLVELQSLEGGAMFNIHGSGFDIIRDNDYAETVLVRDVETIISVGVSAHPYGEYTLNITKL